MNRKTLLRTHFFNLQANHNPIPYEKTAHFHVKTLSLPPALPDIQKANLMVNTEISIQVDSFDLEIDFLKNEADYTYLLNPNLTSHIVNVTNSIENKKKFSRTQRLERKSYRAATTPLNFETPVSFIESSTPISNKNAANLRAISVNKNKINKPARRLKISSKTKIKVLNQEADIKKVLVRKIPFLRLTSAPHSDYTKLKP